jgi:hypothetical protein
MLTYTTTHEGEKGRVSDSATGVAAEVKDPVRYWGAAKSLE